MKIENIKLVADRKLSLDGELYTLDEARFLAQTLFEAIKISEFWFEQFNSVEIKPETETFVTPIDIGILNEKYCLIFNFEPYEIPNESVANLTIVKDSFEVFYEDGKIFIGSPDKSKVESLTNFLTRALILPRMLEFNNIVRIWDKEKVAYLEKFVIKEGQGI